MQEIDFNHLEKAWRKIDIEQAPFLKRQLLRAQRVRFLEGYRILHNSPLSLVAVCKIHSLLAAGAEVTVTSTPDLVPSSFSQALHLLWDSGVGYVSQEDVNGEYDFHLDFRGQLAKLPPPRLGTVEITTEGYKVYSELRASQVPVLNLQGSKIRFLTLYFGVADACLRGLSLLSPAALRSKKALIIGFSNVGQGIAQMLRKYIPNIRILDINAQEILHATQQGFEAALGFHDGLPNPHAADLIASSDLIITATKRTHVISDLYPVELFRNKILANAGTTDEFGPRFQPHEVLNEKRPLNTALSELVAARYLDPICYLQNSGIEIILERGLQKGCHHLPNDIDNAVTNAWSEMYKEDLNMLLYNFKARSSPQDTVRCA